jgi:hypothetical protein
MWLTGGSKGAPSGKCQHCHHQMRFIIYRNASLATRPGARCSSLCWMEIVLLLVLLLIETTPPRPFLTGHQASRNTRYFAPNQVSVGYVQRRQPPHVAFGYVSAPSKSKPYMLRSDKGWMSSMLLLLPIASKTTH